MPKISDGVQIRNGVIFVNKMLNGKYHRFSTGLESNRNNLRYVRKNIMQIIADKERETQENVSGADFREKMRLQKNEKKNAANQIKQLFEDTPALDVEPDGFSNSKKDFTLKECVAILSKEWNQLKPTTKISYKDALRKFFKFFGNDCPIASINRAKVMDFVNDSLEKGYKKGTISTRLTILKRILVLAEQYEIIEKVPNIRVKIPAEQTATEENKPFTEDEVRLLLKNCKNEVLKNYLQIAFFTGCRTGEILALKWSDVDLYSGKISVNKTINQFDITTPKTRSSIREIDILPLVKEALKNQKSISGKSEFIFCDKEEYVGFYTKLQREWKRLLKEVGLEYRTLYHTRHTFASIMLSHNENLLWVSKRMLGHSNTNMTLKIYAHYVETQGEQHGAFLKNFLKEEIA